MEIWNLEERVLSVETLPGVLLWCVARLLIDGDGDEIGCGCSASILDVASALKGSLVESGGCVSSSILVLDDLLYTDRHQRVAFLFCTDCRRRAAFSECGDRLIGNAFFIFCAVSDRPKWRRCRWSILFVLREVVGARGKPRKVWM